MKTTWKQHLLMMALSAAAIGATLATSPRALAADLVDTASKAGKFTTLLAAVEAAGLVETLKGAGPFTLFAPSDEAFGKIPKAQLDALLKDKAALSKLLTSHVVAGQIMAKDVKAGPLKTASGAEITVVTEGGVTVGGAKVVTTDIAADNGVIHVIDTVIVPK
jgi:uncharacterized surface protein with fasciclin (FAS1) repeats